MELDIIRALLTFSCETSFDVDERWPRWPPLLSEGKRQICNHFVCLLPLARTTIESSNREDSVVRWALFTCVSATLCPHLSSRAAALTYTFSVIAIMQQSFILSIVVLPVLPDMTSTAMMEAFSTHGHLHSLIRLAIVHLDYRHSLSCHPLQRPSLYL
jgi:hypothetical protein